MRYPKYLKENGTIGFVAPSCGAAIEPYYSAFNNAQKKFKELGNKMVLGPNCYLGKGIGISNTPKECAKELMDYYCNDNNDVIISCGGGELMCEILDYMDFEKIKSASPKWYMGYSDNTNFTFLLTTICDVASIYGPCAGTFGQEPWHESVQDAYDILTGKKKEVTGYDKWERESLKSPENPLASYNVTEERILKVYEPETASIKEKEACKTAFSGRLVGGCMDCLANLVGTDFDNVKNFNEKYKEDGIVWFIEACELNVMDIRRTLWNMEHAGWFKYVKGFIFGRPLCFGEEIMGLDHYSAVTGILSKYNVPIIMDADIGHFSPMMPMVCGSYAEVDVKGNDIKIHFNNV